MILTGNLNAVFIKLTPTEVQQIKVIELDGDDQQALRFIKENLASKIDHCLQSSCALTLPGWSPHKCNSGCRQSREVCCISGRRFSIKPRANQDRVVEEG